MRRMRGNLPMVTYLAYNIFFWGLWWAGLNWCLGKKSQEHVEVSLYGQQRDKGATYSHTHECHSEYWPCPYRINWWPISGGAISDSFEYSYIPLGRPPSLLHEFDSPHKICQTTPVSDFHQMLLRTHPVGMGKFSITHREVTYSPVLVTLPVHKSTFSGMTWYLWLVHQFWFGGLLFGKFGFGFVDAYPFCLNWPQFFF